MASGTLLYTGNDRHGLLYCRGCKLPGLWSFYRFQLFQYKQLQGYCWSRSAPGYCPVYHGRPGHVSITKIDAIGLVLVGLPAWWSRKWRVAITMSSFGFMVSIGAYSTEVIRPSEPKPCATLSLCTPRHRSFYRPYKVAVPFQGAGNHVINQAVLIIQYLLPEISVWTRFP